MKITIHKFRVPYTLIPSWLSPIKIRSSREKKMLWLKTEWVALVHSNSCHPSLLVSNSRRAVVWFLFSETVLPFIWAPFFRHSPWNKQFGTRWLSVDSVTSLQSLSPIRAKWHSHPVDEEDPLVVVVAASELVVVAVVAVEVCDDICLGWTFQDIWI